MRAAAYIRLSKDSDRTTSYSSQREAIANLCKARGWALAEADVYTERGRSAYNGRHRPELERLLANLSGVGVVVVLRLDRLARTLSELLRLGGVLQDAGVQLAAVDGDIDTTTATGEAFFNIRGALAQFESRSLSDRMKRLAKSQQADGKHWGTVPYGFQRNEEGGLVPVPEQMNELEAIARRYVGGESLRQVAKTTRFSHANLAKMLKRKELLDALPDDLSARLSVELAERGRTGTTATPSLLGGILRCSVCSETMTVVGMSTRQGRRPRGSYGCRAGHLYVTRDRADEIVSEQVLARIDVDQLARRMAKRKRPSKPLEVAGIEARLELLETDHYDGKIPRDRFERNRDRLLAQLERGREQARQDEGPNISLELARQLKSPGVWESLTVAGRRQIIKAFVQQIVVARANGHGPVDPSRLNIDWR